MQSKKKFKKKSPLSRRFSDFIVALDLMLGKTVPKKILFENRQIICFLTWVHWNELESS
jgi:hypothetical protein